jgi:hydrogenase nickel incorporation protein HypA/HybF
MHEVSIAQAIVTAVSDAVDGEQVERVEVTVGAMSGVVASALEFAWDVVTNETPLAGSVLVVESVPTTVYCPTCAAVVEPPVGFVCPSCGELCGDVRSGRELEVRSAHLREPVDSQP